MTQRSDGLIPRSLKRRSITAGLAEEVQQVYGNRCPCCNRVMVRHRPSKIRWKVPRDHPTVAHDIATGSGGNPVVWVYACNACNAEQGSLSFEEWGRHLAYFKDERAPRVLALAAFVAEWCETNDVPRMLEKKRRRPTPWISAA